MTLLDCDAAKWRLAMTKVEGKLLYSVATRSFWAYDPSIMETITSFAPLAGRLAARAAELRPVEGSRDNLAKFAALVMCALLDMLVLVCEMMDARALAGVRPVAGQQANLTSLDLFKRTPSCAGLARVPTSLPARMWQVVENRAKPGHDDTETIAVFGLAEIVLSGPVSRGAGLLQGVQAPSLKPSSRKAALRPWPTYAHFVTIS